MLTTCYLPTQGQPHRSLLLSLRSTYNTLLTTHLRRYVTQLTGGAATNDLLFTFHNPSVAEVIHDAML
jgi:hypothetical protein